MHMHPYVAVVASIQCQVQDGKFVSVEVLASGPDVANVLSHRDTSDIVTQWFTKAHFHRHLLNVLQKECASTS